jgi:predicted enzyme related to lactoylglutathione lyase
MRCLIGDGSRLRLAPMKRVTGLGGIFFKADDPDGLRDWYGKHLGLGTDEYGASFKWRDFDEPEKEGYTVWSPFSKDSDYFAPSEKSFMVNFRVANLDEILAQLKSEGVTVDDETEDSELGRFGWIMDPEGNRIELWEPPPGSSKS